MKSISARILITIAVANNLEVMTGDIGNAYPIAETEEKIYTHTGAEFYVLGIMPEGDLLVVFKAIYGLPTSGNRWHAHLAHALREIFLNRLILTRMSGLGGVKEAMIILVRTLMTFY